MKRLLHTLTQKLIGLRAAHASARQDDGTHSQPRLRQAHFDMMRAIEYGGGQWHSDRLGPWRFRHRKWLDASVRQQSWDTWHETYPGRRSASLHATQTQWSGPDIQTCRALCRDLVARGFAVCDEGHDSDAPVYRLTERGRGLIGLVSHTARAGEYKAASPDSRTG